MEDSNLFEADKKVQVRLLIHELLQMTEEDIVTLAGRKVHTPMYNVSFEPVGVTINGHIIIDVYYGEGSDE